jgi:hypothetical protein
MAPFSGATVTEIFGVTFPNRVSAIFIQEPSVGISKYLTRLGRVAKYARVSFEICAEWLSKINRIAESGG